MRRAPREIAQPVIGRIDALLAESSAPVFVAIDGRSGAGKSTIAGVVAASSRTGDEPTSATLIEGDDFYGGGSAETWDQRSIEDSVAAAIDWRRQYSLLSQLRHGQPALVDPFDWASPDWDRDGSPLSGNTYTADPARLVILEGVYSARPELREFFDLRVLVDIDADLRRGQLVAREGEHMNTSWEERWGRAEDHYFETQARPGDFDLVIGT